MWKPKTKNQALFQMDEQQKNMHYPERYKNDTGKW